jgi:hypothetical protein
MVPFVFDFASQPHEGEGITNIYLVHVPSNPTIVSKTIRHNRDRFDPLI